MLITADVGNTQSVFGTWLGKNLLSKSRFSTAAERTGTEWYLLLKDALNLPYNENSRQVNAIYASVVPRVNSALEEAFKKLQVHHVEQVNRDMNLPFTFNYDGADTLGADRLANAAAGVEVYGDDLIIVDFGTAITFCLVLNRVYVGGVIAPGISSAMQALFSKAAKLPEIDLALPRVFPGTNTVNSIAAGAYYAMKGLVREIVSNLLNKAKKENSDPLVIATGGISESLGFAHEFFDVVDQHLTLRGLQILHRDNTR